MATNPQIKAVESKINSHDVSITFAQLIGVVGGAISVIFALVLFTLESIKDDLRHAITEQSENLRNVSNQNQENIRNLIQSTKDDARVFREELKNPTYILNSTSMIKIYTS